MMACSAKERAFVWHLVCNGGDGKAAAIAAGYSNTSEGAKVRAFEVRHRPRVIEAIHECGWRLLGSLGVTAVSALESLVLRPEHPDHFKAVTAVLSRIGFHEKTGIDVNVSGTVELSHTDAALEALAHYKALQVPRERLVEQFGHSGLERYERMLEEREAKKGMKVIEHEDKT